MTIEQIISDPALKSRIEKRDSDGTGCSCMFFDLGNGQGIKVYNSDEICDKTHKAQQDLAQYGIAPNTGKKFRCGGKFCYETEVVNVVGTVHEPSSMHYAPYAAAHDKIVALKWKLRKRGYLFPDAHLGNVGFRDDNPDEYLVIDCELGQCKITFQNSASVKRVPMN